MFLVRPGYLARRGQYILACHTPRVPPFSECYGVTMPGQWLRYAMRSPSIEPNVRLYGTSEWPLLVAVVGERRGRWRVRHVTEMLLALAAVDWPPRRAR